VKRFRRGRLEVYLLPETQLESQKHPKPTSFVRGYVGHRFASTKQVAEMSESFVKSIMQFSLDHKIDLVRFQKGQRRARVPRTVRKAFGNGSTIPWINYSSANVNFYYFYCLDEEFGPFFIYRRAHAIRLFHSAGRRYP
jgi:hypothetical protein